MTIGNITLPFSKPVFIAIIAAIVLLFIVIIRLVAKSNARKKEMATRAEDRLREEALDRVIVNAQANIATFAEKPVEVNYVADPNSNVTQNTKRTSGKLMLQITETSELSKRKYMLNPENGILIGSRQGANNIVITDPGVDDNQCEIIFYQNELYVRNVGQMGQITLLRGRKSALVGQGTVLLKKNDVLCIGNTQLKIEFLHL